MVLVDLWSRLKQWLHEQVQKGRHSDLKAKKKKIFQLMASLTSMQWICTSQRRLSPHQLHRRWVHAAEHLEQNCDICRIQGSFGQHGTQRLASSRIGCCCAECERYLTGIMTSKIQTTTSELLSPVKSKQHNQCTSFYWHFSVACQSPIIKKIDASVSHDPGSACCKYWVTVLMV